MSADPIDFSALPSDPAALTLMVGVLMGTLSGVDAILKSKEGTPSERLRHAQSLIAGSPMLGGNTT